MFIIYVLSRDFKSWDYQCTLKADLPDIAYQLIQTCEDYDGYCNQWNLFNELANYQYYQGANIRIYFVEVSYGIWQE